MHTSLDLATAMRTLGALVLAVLMLCGFSAEGTKRPATAPGSWTADELKVISSLRLDNLPPAPKDASNAFEASPQAAVLGKRLFGDPRFSRNQAVSCASCHSPEKQFQDGLPVGQGIGTGSRRAMPLVGTAHSPWLFWDGRKDSLWSQALGPLEDAVEHGGNRTRYARLVQSHYRTEYEALFGRMPDLPSLPQDAGPLGTVDEQAAWQAMAPKRREEVSRIFANMGKAIAAYEQRLVHGESRFDGYALALTTKLASGEETLLPAEVNGLRLFIGRGQCVTCHNGPLLSDQHFHNTGVPPRDPAKPDRGRAAAIAKVQGDEFNCLGPFSDARPEQCAELRFIVADDPALEGAFKTPSLRNVALRPPYMHAGQFTTLEQVVGHYLSAPAAPLGHSELSRDGRKRPGERAPIRLSAQETSDLIAFLATLSGPTEERRP
jgi:cytochrome c peroxidase